MAVGEANERKIEAAALALLRGRAILTDGRLTMENLHIEACVSRATMNRSEAAAWFRRTVDRLRHQDAKEEPDGDRRRLAETNARLRSELNHAIATRDAAALVILALHRENQALRDAGLGNVRPLDRRLVAGSIDGGSSPGRSEK